MKIIELVNKVSLPITNEESDVLGQFQEKPVIRKAELNERQQELARQLLREETEQKAKEEELRIKEKELKSIEAERLQKVKADQERERELILEKERLIKLEKEEDRTRQEKFEEEERIKQEELRIKEWERKFDEEQKIKEEALMKKFYEDNTEDNKNIDTSKSDKELNQNEINYEGSDKDESSK